MHDESQLLKFVDALHANDPDIPKKLAAIGEFAHRLVADPHVRDVVGGSDPDAINDADKVG